MNDKQFYAELKKIGIVLDQVQKNLLTEYKNFLIEYNKNVNLTRITSDEDINLKHYYDSLCVTNYFDFNNIFSLVDVGTGAGFPGVVLKIVYPKLHVLLLESNNKKCEFLNQLIEKFNLKNIEVINERAEIFARNNKDKYDVVISRAVANLKVLSELCLPLVKVNGKFIAMKGAFVLTSEEIMKSQKIINELKGSVHSVNQFLLYDNENERTIIIVNKEKKTPSRFPRDYKTIIKND